ncbi:hypothetical protein CGMCC3_g7808 [Colletotrichum fructicola]|nr:uncharacterized protein CGMCC3_g7808 [Colletotrichum fructicola]KAE9576163.1 hypothetical protein CGMCC3_g7808 [Colletotrichum fructicola]
MHFVQTVDRPVSSPVLHPTSAAQRADPGFVAAGGRPYRRLRLIWALLSSGASAARAA